MKNSTSTRSASSGGHTFKIALIPAVDCGTSGAAPLTRFDPSRHRVKFACEVKGFDPGLYMDRKEAKRADLFGQATNFAIESRSSTTWLLDVAPHQSSADEIESQAERA